MVAWPIKQFPSWVFAVDKFGGETFVTNRKDTGFWGSARKIVNVH